MPKTVKRKKNLKRHPKRKPKTKRQAGGGPKKEAASAAAKSFKPFMTKLVLPPMFTQYDHILSIEPYAPRRLPTVFPNSDRITLINFVRREFSYNRPLRTNILSQINFLPLQNLTTFLCDYPNAVNGTLPTDLFTLPNIQAIRITESKTLTGPIPNLPQSLVSLVLFDNSLNGSLPELPPNLTMFDVRNNQLSGIIHDNVIRRIAMFKISGNNFFSEDESDTIQSLKNLLSMVQRGFINFRGDPEFYEVFDDMPPEIQASDEAKLTYLIERFEESADPLMG